MIVGDESGDEAKKLKNCGKSSAELFYIFDKRLFKDLVLRLVVMSKYALSTPKKSLSRIPIMVHVEYL